MSDIKIHRWILNQEIDFRDVDYVRGLPVRLAPEHTFDKGSRIKTVYYVNAELLPNGEVDYSDPVVEENYSYVFNPHTGLAVERDLTIEWFLEDDTKHPVPKLRSKIYTLKESIAEGSRRRRNVLHGLQQKVIEILFAVNGGLVGQPDAMENAISQAQDFSAKHQAEITDYLENGSSKLAVAITNDSEAWLDTEVSPSVTARMVILNEL
jgi:hypothetical protein